MYPHLQSKTLQAMCCTLLKNVGGASFNYYINRLSVTKVDSTYLGCLTRNTQRICPVARLERMTTGSVVNALPYRAIQVDTY